MALGLAVITTQNCGSIIKHMENGIIVEYGSEEQIIEAVSLMREQRDMRIGFSNQAMKDVKDFSWDSYGVKLKNFISSL
jgi:glycosyltransferase involved in cell wall biosynthesis